MVNKNKFVILFYAYFLNLFSKAADIVFFLYVVKLLVKEDMGVFNTTMSVSACLYVLLNGGFVESALREIAGHQTNIKDIVKKCLASRIVLIIILYSVLGASYKLEWFDDNVFFTYVFYGATFQIITWVQNLYVSALKASDRQNKANLIVSIDSTIKLLLILVVSSLYDVDLIMLWQITIAAKLITVAFPMVKSIINLNVLSIQIKNDYFVLLGQGQFIAITIFTLAQNRLDWMLIAAYLDQESVATYSVANRFYEIIIFVVGIGSTTIYPWICKSINEKESNKDSKNIGFLNKIQLYLGLVIISLAIEVFPYVNVLMWESKYTDVNDILRYILPCLILAITNMKLYYEILAKRMERYIIPIALLSTLCQSIFNIYSINRFGINGAIGGMWLLNALNVILFTLLLNNFKLPVKKYFFGDIGLSYLLSFTLLYACIYLTENLIFTCTFAAIIGVSYEWKKLV